jgi:hypothetical protein
MVLDMTMYYEAPSLTLLGTVAELTATNKIGGLSDGLSANQHYSCESGASNTCGNDHREP